MLQTPNSCQDTTCSRPSWTALAVAFLSAQARLAARPFAAGYCRLRAAARRRHSYRELSRMPDHTLRDIGRGRAQLRDAVWKREIERERARRRSNAPSVGFD